MPKTTTTVAKPRLVNRPKANPPAPKKDLPEQLQESYAALSLSISKMGNQRALNEYERTQAAQTFNAESNAIGAFKRLFDRKNKKVQKVHSIQNQAYLYWQLNSLPFPESGIRLFPRDTVEKVVAELEGFRARLDEAVEELEGDFESIKEDAKRRLGDLYRESDYPASVRGLYAINWTFHNVEPPSYLMQLNPSLYQEEKAKMMARLSEAVEMAEQAFMEEFAKLVSHLTEVLKGTNDDGKPKIFHNSTVENVREFFDRFRSLSLRSNPQLDKLVEDAKGLLRGVSPDSIRNSWDFRKKLASSMTTVENQLTSMMEARPSRRIVRSAAVVEND